MTLAPGTRLGPYEIVAPIGAGGMGEVYRAHDANLNRDVALKVLLDSVVGDADRMARFKREAHVLASLNHPNIAHLYGFEVAGGGKGVGSLSSPGADPRDQERAPTPFLVMELVEGPTLADVIDATPGGLPLDQALSIARQIAEALEAAHEQGIVHRDLKPANVKVRDDGVVKVLDFGLAKALSPEGAGATAGSAEAINSPTLTARATQMGMILGTAAYMSPEQAKGRAVDKRADVWAFGAVLYEMLTGERAFKGEDMSETLAAVLRQEIPLSALPASTPPRLARLIGRCLERDLKQRLRDIGEARIELARLEAGGADVMEPAPSALAASVIAGRTRRERAAWIGIALAAAAGAAAATWLLTPAPIVTNNVGRFSYALPADQVFTRTGRHLIAISPDGSKIVYVANSQLYLRPVGQLEAQPIPGSNEDPLDPVFSPDSQWIAYFTNGPSGSRGMLKKIAVSGGTPVPLCPADGTFGISWQNGLIAFGQNGGKVFGIQAVADSGGTPYPLVSVEPRKEQAVQPQLLDDGMHVLYTLMPVNQTGDEGQIVIQRIGDTARTLVFKGGTNGQVLPTGHLIYIHKATISAVPFDAKRLAVTGDSVQLFYGVRETNTTFAGHFGVSRDGTLAYVPGAFSASVQYSLVWVDAQGKERLFSEKSRTFIFPRLSPDETRVAAVASDEEHDLYVWDLATKVSKRLTFGPAHENDPLWMPPDNRWVIFVSRDSGGADIFRRMADGTGPIESLTRGGTGGFPQSVSRDGKYLVYQRNRGSSADLMLLPLEAGGQPRPLLADPSFDETGGEISPDGNWIAYLSNESGRNQVLVRPFPNVDGGSLWQVSSSDGGFNPRWSRSGHELYFVSNLPHRLMRATVLPGSTFTCDTLQPVLDLTPWRDVLNTGRRGWDMADDGRLLLSKNSADPANAIVVVSHWFDELRARMGGKRQ